MMGDTSLSLYQLKIMYSDEEINSDHFELTSTDFTMDEVDDQWNFLQSVDELDEDALERIAIAESRMEFEETLATEQVSTFATSMELSTFRYFVTDMYNKVYFYLDTSTRFSFGATCKECNHYVRKQCFIFVRNDYVYQCSIDKNERLAIWAIRSKFPVSYSAYRSFFNQKQIEAVNECLAMGLFKNSMNHIEQFIDLDSRETINLAIDMDYIDLTSFRLSSNPNRAYWIDYAKSYIESKQHDKKLNTLWEPTKVFRSNTTLNSKNDVSLSVSWGQYGQTRGRSPTRSIPLTKETIDPTLEYWTHLIKENCVEEFYQAGDQITVENYSILCKIAIENGNEDILAFLMSLEGLMNCA